MQLEIHPSIKPRVRELNEQARQMLEQHGSPRNAQFLFGNGMIKNQLRFTAKAHKQQIVRTIHFTEKKEDAPSDTSVENWHAHILAVDQEGERQLAEQRATALRTPTLATRLNKLNEELQAEVIANAGLQKNQHAIELGPGEGNVLNHLLKTGAKVTAIDYSLPTIEKLQRKFATELQSGQLTLHNKQYTDPELTTQLPREQVDHVFTFDGTGQHPNPEELYKLIHRTLKPGGKFTLVQTTPFYNHIIAQLKEAGFTVEKTKVQEALPKQQLPQGRTFESYITAITAVKE